MLSVPPGAQVKSSPDRVSRQRVFAAASGMNQTTPTQKNMVVEEAQYWCEDRPSQGRGKAMWLRGAVIPGGRG